MSDLLWTFIFIQMALGAFDTFYHHELTERLAWRSSQEKELRLHGVRNLIYAIVFAGLGWTEPQGLFAWLLIVLVVGELGITLWDFVEEDRSRKLPASERVLHTLLTLNYGVVLALLLPVLLAWAANPTQISVAFHGMWSWLCAIAAVGVVISGLRDLAAALRARRIKPVDPAPLAGGLPGRRNILVTGGTGFVGTRLVSDLVAAGHSVTVLTRSRDKAAHLPAPIRIVTDLEQIDGGERVDAIVNLAGEPLGDGLWTLAKRRRILRSRLEAARNVERLVGRLKSRPTVLVNASAIGWYGLHGDEVLDEESAGREGFCRDVCLRWERAAMRVSALGVRTVCLRIGLVLGAEGGVLSRMLTPFEFGLGGPFGTGRHWMSWIHRDDLVRLIVHAIAEPSLAGAVNATAPAPVTNAAFSKALGKALNRPAILAVPAWPLRKLLGAFADELLLGGQLVLPMRALRSGFRYDYPVIDDALREIVGRPAEEREPAKGTRGDNVVRILHGVPHTR